MTDDDAYEIQVILIQLEFPFTCVKALQFALFRTYGIPAISKLLVATSQLSDIATASKRYADTAVLIREFMSHPPAHPRTLEAIARMNYIHSLYQKSGAIRDDDMLFTLSLFALEPIRWIERYEWRNLEEFEQCALGVFWKSIGDAMGISYEKLRNAKEGWRDGLSWLEDLTEWSRRYEEEHMLPHDDNKKTAEETVAILLIQIPKLLKPFAKQVVSALMDHRLRTAMMYEKPPNGYFLLLSCIFGIRKYLLRYFFWPRPFFLRMNALEEPDVNGRASVCLWEGAPYYVKPTLWRRWGPEAWGSRLVGVPVPGDEGEKFLPQGYRIAEVGPKITFGKGVQHTEETISRLQQRRTGGCPFVRVKDV